MSTTLSWQRLSRSSVPQDPVRFKVQAGAAWEAQQNREQGRPAQVGKQDCRRGKQPPAVFGSGARVGVQGREGPTIQSTLPSTVYRLQCKSFWPSHLGL